MEAEKGWAVVICKPNCERAATRSLTDAGYNAFWPSYRVLARPFTGGKRAGKLEIVDRTLFAGYTFVMLEPRQEFAEGTFFPGVVRLLRYSPMDGYTGRPKLIPACAMEAIVLACSRGEFDKLPASKRIDAEPGDFVRPLDGPFAGFIGKLQEIDDDRERAVVMLSIFGRGTPVEFRDPGQSLELAWKADEKNGREQWENMQSSA